MAAPQTPERRPLVGAAGVGATLIAAKCVSLLGHPWPHTAWAVFAVFWQDVLVALGFALVEFVAPARRVVRALYLVMIAYVLLNVPVSRALGSPMTWTMWRAAAPAMADSALYALSPSTILATIAVLAVAVVTPVGWRRLAPRFGVTVAVVAVVFVALGIAVDGRVDVRGHDTNAFGALLRLPPAVAAGADGTDLRRSPFDSLPNDDLSSLRGAGRGLNVVMVILESTAAEYLRLYGAPDDPTPALTALGRSGMVFDSAYAVYPESIRELFAALCARAPGYDATAEEDATLPCRSLPDELHQAGYRTALFHSGRFDYLGMRAVVEHRGFDTLEDAAQIGGRVHSSFGVDEETTVNRMLAWIDAQPAGRPFFLSYLPIEGHHPYATHQAGPYDGHTEAGQYRNALHEGDAALGVLLAGLRARGLSDRTIVVAFGDHGEAFGQHDGNTGHSLFIYDENVRVPLVIRLPHAPMKRVVQPVSVEDVGPTILDLVGLLATPSGEGHSMLDPSPRVSFFFTDYSRVWVGLRDGCRTYMQDVVARRPQLFDVCADPSETQDRSAAEPDRVRRYGARTLDWLAASRAGLTRSARPPS